MTTPGSSVERRAPLVTVADQVLVSGANFATLIVLARALGLDAFGRFSIVALLVLLFTAAQNALCVTPLMSLAPAMGRAHPAFFSTIAALTAALATVTALVGTIVTAIAWDDRRVPVLVVVAASLLVIQLREFQRRHHFVSGQLTRAVVGDAIVYGGQLIGALVLAGLGALRSPATALGVIGVTAGVGLLFELVAGYARQFVRQFDRVVARSVWEFGRWQLGSAAVNWLSGYALILLAGVYLDVRAVGGIRAAQSLGGIVNVVLLSTENWLPARTTRVLTERGPAAMNVQLRRLSLYGAGVVSVIILPVLIGPQFWMELLYGKRFGDYGVVLVAFALQSIPAAVATVLQAGLRSAGRTKQLFFAYVAGGGLGAVSGLMLISFFGLAGLAVSIVLTPCLVSAAYAWSLRLRQVEPAWQ